MRVIQLGPYPPPQGGVQSHIVAVRRYLRERGHSCAVINLHRHRTSTDEEVYHPVTPIDVFKLLFTQPADVVHLHIGLQTDQPFPFRLMLLSLVCGWLPGRKSVFTFHSGGYPQSQGGKTASPWTFRGFVFRQFDHVIAVNPALLQVFHRFGIGPDRAHLIYPYELPAAPAHLEVPERMQAFLKAHRPTFMSVGLLEDEYDLPLQIRALGRIRQRFPNAGLVLVGSGSREQALREQIAATPYAEHILLYGDLAHPYTLRTMMEVDALLRTTIADGDSVSVREALHFGLPVIATDNGMRPEGTHLFPVGDEEALCETIARVLTRPKPRTSHITADDRNIAEVVKLYFDGVKRR